MKSDKHFLLRIKTLEEIEKEKISTKDLNRSFFIHHGGKIRSAIRLQEYVVTEDNLYLHEDNYFETIDTPLARKLYG